MCFLAKISLHRSTCKTTFARSTQSQPISESFRVFISFRSMRDTTFFFIFRNFFLQNYRFLYHGDRKISWWTSCRWRAVNFDIHLWSSGMNGADCIWRSISIQHVQIEAGLNSDPGNDSLWDKIRDAKHVDRSTHYIVYFKIPGPSFTKWHKRNFKAPFLKRGRHFLGHFRPKFESLLPTKLRAIDRRCHVMSTN